MNIKLLNTFKLCCSLLWIANINCIANSINKISKNQYQQSTVEAIGRLSQSNFVNNLTTT